MESGLNSKRNQSRRKLLNFLDDFIKSQPFQDEVLKLRKSCGIPPNGFTIPDDFRSLIEKEGWTSAFWHVPKEISTGKKKNSLKDLNLRIREICHEIGMSDLVLTLYLKMYIFYNEQMPALFQQDAEYMNLCKVEDLNSRLKECEDLDFEFGLFESLQKESEYYPIVIKLHPATSQRDLLSFVKGYWPIIDYRLESYRKKNLRIGKVKQKNSFVTERNEFILEHKHLSAMEIMRMLGKKFGPRGILDVGYIGKIISAHKKRGKEV